MPDFSDYFNRVTNALNAAAAPAFSSAYSLNMNNAGTVPINPSPLPIQVLTVISRTTSNPTATYVIEGSLDGTNWATIITPAAPPTVGAPKYDVKDPANVMFVRVNLSAISAGNLSVDLLLAGTPS